MIDFSHSSNPILRAFGRRVARRPDDAIVESGTAVATARDVSRLASDTVRRLRQTGLGPSDLIALQAPNGPAFLAGLLALFELGAVAVLLDAGSPQRAVVAVRSSLGLAGELGFATAWPRPADVRIQRYPSREGPNDALPESTGVVKLTSGSTGAPKGILVSCESLIADDVALTMTMGLGADESILAAVPMSHSYGLSSVVMPALMRDCRLAVPSGSGPLAPILECQLRGVSFLPTVPAFLAALVDLAEPPAAPPSLDLVVSAGAPLRPDTARRFRQVYDLPVHVFYGASEAGGITYDRTGLAAERGSVGSPVEGVEVSIRPLPGAAPGTLGRVVVSSPAVANRYLPANDPEHLSAGEFRTNDLGTMEKGELYLEGRLDDLLDVKGKLVNPREVEAVVQSLDGVADVMVVPGEGSGRLVAYVVSSPSITSSGVRAWCREHLAGYKVPRGVVLVDEIPRTGRGKVDRKALATLRQGRVTRRDG